MTFWMNREGSGKLFKKTTGMKNKHKKIFVALTHAIGIPAVAYGMVSRNHYVFITGLLLIIAAYLVIRRELKASGRNPH